MNDINYIKPFIEELNKYEDGVHKLNIGVNRNIIEYCEDKLGINFPIEYKEFLMVYNGGELFALPAGTEIAEIYLE